MHRSLPLTATGFAALLTALGAACGSPPPPAPPPSVGGASVAAASPSSPAQASATSDVAKDAAQFLSFYDGVIGELVAHAQEADWHSATDVSEAHSGERVGAESVLAGFSGSAYVIRRAKELLAHASELDDLTVRQLKVILLDAANAPALDADLLARRLNAEAKQAATQDGFTFCLARAGAKCTKTATANDIDDILKNSRDLAARENAWKASKEVGVPLRQGILALRDLRNATAQELGYKDFYELQIADYGMTTDEMMALLDKALADTKPLFKQLHCYAANKLAKRYKQPAPKAIPAAWIGNRWAQAWPGLVESIDLDPAFKTKEPAWFVEQAERYYVSMGFAALPKTFWEKSDLYPVKPGDPRKKNSHASAWHMDLGADVRSLMSVKPTEEWFLTTHHELGHIYYYISYSTPSVPMTLRRGANRAYHEGIGELIAMSVLQEPYLRQLGILPADKKLDKTQMLLDMAFTKGPVYLTFSAGTMAHFEKDLYAGKLAPAELNARWWKYVADFQGVVPPGVRDETECDACSKTHINDDPGGYYDYALAAMFQFQLHEHLCRDIVHADPHECTYAGNKEVGAALKKILEPGASKDWRKVLKEATGEDLSAAAMLRYYAPLVDYLAKENAGAKCE